jgi:hypothetical protein
MEKFKVPSVFLKWQATCAAQMFKVCAKEVCLKGQRKAPAVSSKE